VGRRFCLLLAAFFVGIFSVAAEPTADRLVEEGHWKRLRALAEPLVAANPNDSDAAYYLARAKEEFGDLQGALLLAEKAVALAPNSARNHWELGNVCIELGEKAGIFKGMGLAHRFRDEQEKAVALDPKFVDARQSLMEFYYDAPGIAGGDKKKAWATAQEISQIDPVRGLLAQADLAAKEKNRGKQVDFYDKALASAPDDPRVLRQAASFYASDSVKKLDMAEKYALEALQLDAGRKDMYLVLAIVYAATERWKDLDGIVTKSEQNIPDDFSPHYQAGKVLLVSGKDLPRAERYFRKYLTIEPEGGEPKHAAAHWRLGLVLEKEGKKEEALGEMETSLRLDPDFKEAKQDLKRLKK
jgi:tetratricopeptide (TPR) repeat protein